MILLIIFYLAGLFFSFRYFFRRDKFSPLDLFLAVWLFAIGTAQIRLSPLELAWDARFWLILLVFFAVFTLSHFLFFRLLKNKIKSPVEEAKPLANRDKICAVIFLILTLLTAAANFYIYRKFGTLPILSSKPDKLRFIINKEIFGAWEYLALLPRLTIPLSLIYLWRSPGAKKWLKILLAASALFGLAMLFLYASRLIVLLPVVLSYFAYLIIKIKKINFKKIAAATVAVGAIVVLVSLAMPAVRQRITYKDYYRDIDDSAFNYIYTLSELKIPKEYGWITPLYLIPSFNLQELYRASDYYAGANLLYGRYTASTFAPAAKIFHLPFTAMDLPWKQIFLFWWITGTALLSFWVDFGWVGMVAAGVFWSALFASVYVWAARRPSFMAVAFFAYVSFMAMMSIYTNYFLRQECYLDLFFIFALGLILEIRFKNFKLASFIKT